MIAKNKNIKKKFIVVIAVMLIVNVISLGIYFKLWLHPFIEKNNNMKNEIDNLIKKELSFEEFNDDVKLYQEKYNFDYIIKDNNYNIIYKTISSNSRFLYSNIIKFDNNIYLLELYNANSVSLGRVISRFMIFQFLLVLLITILILFIVNKTIFNPIDKIINDIKEYKSGKRPKKIKIISQIDLIQNEFVDLVDLLEEEKKEQNRIIASISHDIKTPLTSIIGYSNLIEEGELSKEQIIKYNSKINFKSKTIKEILNSFDDYLINSKKQLVKLQSILIKDLIKEIKNDYLLELEFKNISFDVKSDCSNMYIKIDLAKIKRVIANIIQNSIRYIRANGKIEINIEFKDNNFIFYVMDNAKGVEDAIIERIFDPFYTTDKSRKISGLGLSICKEFIMLHNGTITAYNNDIGGLTIEFTIPNNS